MTDRMESLIESTIKEILDRHQGKADKPCLEEVRKTMPFYGIDFLKSMTKEK